MLGDLDEVIDFLNSSLSRNEEIIKETQKSKELLDKEANKEDVSLDTALKTAFISYGRKHSLHFAHRLYDKLTGEGYKVWFDMNNIPFAVDFQEQIDEGIRQADNFIYIMSPHSVKSEYCLKEVILALKYGKRIIPILHVEPYDCWDRIHPEIGKRNWIYMRENEEPALKLVQQLFTIPASKKTKFLSNPLPENLVIDNFDVGFNGLNSVIQLHNEYVRQHTILLNLTYQWEKYNRARNHLLVGNNRKMAEEFLERKEFYNNNNEETQPPCIPSNNVCEYIIESKKNANNLHTDVFISYSVKNKAEQIKIYNSLNRNDISSWRHDKDIEKGEVYAEAINKGIEQADNFLFFITEESITSDYCDKELKYALKYNKRIIPLLIENVALDKISHEVRKLQFIDFSRAMYESEHKYETGSLDIKQKVEEDVERRREKPLYERKIDELLQAINTDKEYYHLHKTLLSKALKWKQQNGNQSLLLRGYNLENAKNWLKVGATKSHKPTIEHTEFINESIAKIGQLHTEVFISYSRKDGDFARKLNERLQLYNKTTWFDQESIATGADFQHEIYKGIEQSDNFVFIISQQSIESPYCEDEVLYAEQYNKRIITLLWNEPDTTKMPDVLQAIQWIDFEKNSFESSFSELIRALDTDREHVQGHTYWSTKASDWIRNNETSDFLLRGTELELAYEWYNNAIAESKSPPPTDLQKIYIEESNDAAIAARKKEKRGILMLRMLLGISLAALIGAIILSVIAWRLKNVADNNLITAKENLQLAEKRKIEAENNLDSAKKQKARAEKLLKELGNAFNDIQRAKAITEKITSYLSFEGGYSPVRNNSTNKYGYIDKNGNISIPYKYDDAQNFSEGMASVKLNNKYGYINHEGELVIDTLYDMAYPFSEEMARVKIKGKFGFIDNQNNVVLPTQYDEATDFNNGFSIIKQNGMYGVISKIEGIIIPCQFDEISFDDNFNCIKGSQTYELDHEGNYINPFDIINAKDIEKSYINVQKTTKLIICNIGSFHSKKYAFTDHRKNIKSIWFDRVYTFNDGLAKVKIGDNFGFVNTNGVLVIDVKYRNASNFKNGEALVEEVLMKNIQDLKKDDYQLFYINKKGEKIRKFNHETLHNNRRNNNFEKYY